jgi:hypothetical protein
MELQLESTCQNCNREITENFCGNCGQKKFKRIDRKYITDELQYTVVHWNKGLLYSIKKLIKNPGGTARTFVEGDRVNHYKPISLVFVLGGLSGFLSFKVLGLGNIMKEQMATNKAMSASFLNDYVSFWSNYSSFIMLAFIPIMALLTKMAFRKWGHNYYEHIVMNAYGLSCYSALSMLVMYPIFFMVKNNTQLFGFVMNLSMPLIPIMMVWFFKGFYPDRKLTTIILRVLMMFIIPFIFLMIVAVAVGFIIAMVRHK